MALLHHIVRIRQPDDFDYVRNGLMDEVVVNANQLENSVQSTAAVLWPSVCELHRHCSQRCRTRGCNAPPRLD